MKKESFFRKITVYVLTLCMLVSGLFGTGINTAKAAESTTIYFLNSEGWSQVYGYTYADGTTVGTEWPGVAAEAALEMGANWWKITVARNASSAPFNVIFNDNSGSQVDAYITRESSNFMTAAGNVYDSKAAAESAMGIQANGTTVYFYNSDNWSSVYGYVYANGATVGAEWPGAAAEAAAEIGANWWKITVDRNASSEPFNVIFNNNSGSQSEAYITKDSNNFMTTVSDVVYSSKAEAEASAGQGSQGGEGTTTVYFLNSKDWSSVGAYVYGAGEALGPWPGSTPVAAGELGEKWLKIEVLAVPKFNIIFFNTADDTERAELQIPSSDYVYVTGAGQVYGSSLEAELSEGMGDLSQTTTVYFYNNRKWSEVNGYTFVTKDGSDATLGASWPGSAAAAAPEAGDNWWKITVPKVASESNSFKVIFNDGMNQTDGVLITDREKVYVTAASGLYGSAAEAEAAMADDDYNDDDPSEPNEDLKDYEVDLTGTGASLGYTTYEAEAAATNAEVLPVKTTYREDIQSEASGRQAVKLSNTGDYVEFTLKEEANALVLRYCMPDSADGTGINATLSMYINGKETQDISLTSKYAWVYGSYPYTNNTGEGLAHRFFDESRLLLGQTLPAGTTIKLQKNSSDTAGYYIIDFIECEKAEAPLTQPANSLSILSYGAVANDGESDYDALTACISDAVSQGKTVWIPEGTFDFPVKQEIKVNNVTIQGAGMWYTNLAGAGASFHYQGTCKFYDFAMTGVSTIRDDGGDLAGFEGVAKATNVTIENIWMEHMKVGVWSSNTTNLVIQGCRIRDTYADGINLCSGTNNATVRNNSIRNTGDDGIAIWPWQADCTNNTIAYNTVQIPNLANGIAIYGGSGNVAEYNYVCDTINNGGGICIGSEFVTKNGYSGTTTVRYNVLERCGSYHTDYDYPVGAIWIWSSNGPMNADYDVHDNKLYNSIYEGILIDCWNGVSGLAIQNNDMNGGTDGIYIRGNASGSAEVINLNMKDTTGQQVNNENANFHITVKEEPVETKPSESESETKPDNPPVVTPVKVTGVSAVYENGQIKITWENCGAAMYKVSRSDGRSSYKNLTYSASAAGYTDSKELVDAEVYYYRITGYFYDAEGNLVSGEISDAVAVVATDRTPEKVVNFQAAVQNRQVVLTWDKAAGARYYKVSRAAGAAGAYYSLKYNIAETTYTDTTAVSGLYRYKAVGYYKLADGSDWVYGELSDTLYVRIGA